MKVLQLLIVSLVVTIINCDLLDDVNAHIYMFEHGAIGDVLNRLDSPMYMRVVAVAHIGMFDALAAFRPTSTGIASQIPKFPANQRTNRNKNIAVAYALYRTQATLYPALIPGMVDCLNRLGLDPNDKSLNLTTPIGVGNYAAQNALNSRLHDGMNQLGDEKGKTYNRFPYEDYTGYEPKNSAFNLRNIGNWQPNIEPHPIALGEFFIQKHIFPQYGITKSISGVDTSLFNSPPPTQSSGSRSNRRGYKSQVDNVLQESYNLNDRKKLIAEHFNNKSMSLAATAIYLTSKFNRTSVDDTVIIETLVHIASFDAGIVVFKEKVKHDAVRPFSAIRYLYGDKKVSAWGGVGKGPVNDILGREWRSYTRTAPEAEYPSAAVCYCTAQMRAASLYFNTTSLFGLTIPKAKGSSAIESGITPSTDITLGPYATMQEFVDDCANARVYSGVHFRAAVEESKRLCRPLGDAAYEFMKKHI